MKTNNKEESKRISVLEYLGNNWKEYFYKPETMQKIVGNILQQMKCKSIVSDHDEVGYEFVEISSITDLGPERQRMIVLFKNLKNELIEKWSIDITTETPSWNQILYALYDDNSCDKKIILYFKNLLLADNASMVTLMDERNMLIKISEIAQRTEKIFAINVDITDSFDENSKTSLEFALGPTVLFSDRRKKIPSRSIWESSIWSYYYVFFETEPRMQDFIADLIRRYEKMYFSIDTKWTDKGFFMLVYADYELRRKNWLQEDKIKKLADYCPAYKIKAKNKLKKPHIEVQISNKPVLDFIEASAHDKFNYAYDIRKQQMELLMFLCVIFEDFS